MSKLRKLNLGNNQVSDAVSALSNAFTTGACPMLVSLVLDNASIGASGARALGEAVRAASLAQLLELDLHSNSIGDGIEQLAAVLSPTILPLLASLDLSDNR